MQTGDTICAISSALSPSARIIVRLSGDRACEITDALCSGRRPAVLSENHPEILRSTVSRDHLTINNCSFPAWIYRFRAPNSVTGEDIVELHLPGNVLLSRWTLDALVAQGARQAEPGEFTARAYFHGKIDLAQAEGVAATVSAHSAAELSAARQLLAGELSRRLRPLMEEIAGVLALVEAGIDFTEEDISFISAADATLRIEQTIRALRTLLAESSRFELLTHLPKLVLVGRPNAGKSTLLNTLAGHERAVVSPVAGTTRDVLSAMVSLNRGSIELIDVAGLESPAKDAADASTSDPRTQIACDMQRRALATLEAADFVLLIRASDDLAPPIDLPRRPNLIVHTKSDLATNSPAPAVNALSGDGLQALKDELDNMIFARSSGATLALNARHIQCAEQTIASLSRAQNSFGHGAEILALELREALNAIGSILGEVTPDDVLGRIFATFCIGK